MADLNTPAPPVMIDKAEVEELILSEYRYWRDWDDADTKEGTLQIQLGAIGATSNLIAALNGMKAPWHPKEK